jgi:hypothetical protein
MIRTHGRRMVNQRRCLSLGKTTFLFSQLIDKFYFLTSIWVGGITVIVKAYHYSNKNCAFLGLVLSPF